MAMRETADDFKGVLGGHERIPAQDPAQRFELGGWPMRKVRQGAGFDCTVLAVAFTQEDGWR
jgi:hypothetical protein